MPVLVTVVAILGLVWLVCHLCHLSRERAFFSKARLHHFAVVDTDVKRHFLSDPGLPSYFKWKESVLVPVHDQGKCASCWAFAVTECLADRVAVQTGGQVRNSLSAQELLSCLGNGVFDCSRGGIPELAYPYIVAHGIAKEQDYPYENMKGGTLQDCAADTSLLDYVFTSAARADKNPNRVYGKTSTSALCLDLSGIPHDTELYKKRLAYNIQNMKTDLYRHGPIVGTMWVHRDLYTYDGKRVYQHAPTSPLMGGHAIEIIGWCDEGQNTKEPGFQSAYWICRNSWGVKWPKELPYGLMYVRMGINESGIESRASSIEPLLNSNDRYLASSTTTDAVSYSSYQDYVSDPHRVNFLVPETQAEQFA